METPKRYYIEGVEKYQHFSTGLMFAVTAAAIQSAKIEPANGLQTGLEIAAWVLLLASAVIGLFNARATSFLMMAHDAIHMIQDRMNSTVSADCEHHYKELDKAGNWVIRDKQEQLEYLTADFEKSMDSFNLFKKVIDKRTSVQVWAFTAGLLALACARAVPFFIPKA